MLDLSLLCSAALLEEARPLAQALSLPLLVDGDPRQLPEDNFVLVLDEQGLALQQTGRKAPGPIRVEFTEGAADHRRKFGGGNGQMIAKAVGVKSGFYPRVLDATAGLGRDAFVLASLGCHMQLIERSPIVFALLQDGLARGRRFAAAEDAALYEVLMRMELVAQNSIDYLSSFASEPPDVIYLDPMFPERQKSADVKKEMRAFHSLVGADDDADLLLPQALAQARYRVVVKRPRKAPFLNGQAPSYQLEGKSSRYDIYTKQKLPV